MTCRFAVRRNDAFGQRQTLRFCARSTPAAIRPISKSIQWLPQYPSGASARGGGNLQFGKVLAARLGAPVLARRFRFCGQATLIG
jgi:hypothetical protein